MYLANWPKGYVTRFSVADKRRNRKLRFKLWSIPNSSHSPNLSAHWLPSSSIVHLSIRMNCGHYYRNVMRHTSPLDRVCSGLEYLVKSDDSIHEIAILLIWCVILYLTELMIRQELDAVISSKPVWTSLISINTSSSLAKLSYSPSPLHLTPYISRWPSVVS